jgi:hypothetical protein
MIILKWAESLQLTIQFNFNLLNCHKKGIIYKTNIMKDACDEEAHEVETIRLIELWASSFMKVLQ